MSDETELAANAANSGQARSTLSADGVSAVFIGAIMPLSTT